MKLYKQLYILAGFALAGFTACTDHYEEFPVDKYTEDYVFSTSDSLGTKALGILGTIYNDLQSGHSRLGNNYLDAASDDAIPVDMSSYPVVWRLQAGQYSSLDLVDSEMRWSEYYKTIRACNLIIRNIDKVPFNTTFINALGEECPLNRSVKAEARFLRAWNYFQMVERYGGVPIVGDNIYDINDDLEQPRNSFEECVEYIVSELDAVKDSLRDIPMANPGVWAHVATKPACMALKARVLLYAASPLYNENPIEPGNTLISYEKPDAARWKRAADAARDFIEMYGENGNGAFKLAPDFRQAFLSYYTKRTNQELIFFRQGGSGKGIETNNGPLGFTATNLAYGRVNPTQNLVESFPMLDGRMPGESTKYPYDLQNQYENRDPRLNWTVLHNGSQWLGTQLETWQGGGNNPTSGEDYSRTSYYCSKFMGKHENVKEYADVTHLWVYFRYAEILLNFAEAENEALAAPSAEVYKCITDLRARAGIEKGDDMLYGLKANMTKEEMREVIRNERRIEMAFEEHRFFDIRRWRLAETIYQQPLRGMHITHSVNGNTYRQQEVMKVNWENARYYYPIRYTEVIKNKNMVQNPGWK